MNDWHYVTISVVNFDNLDNGEYLWTNRAGYSWPLTQDQNKPDKLIVDPRIPYFDLGYREAALKFEDGKVVAIMGHGDVWYYKTETDKSIGSVRLLDS